MSNIFLHEKLIANAKAYPDKALFNWVDEYAEVVSSINFKKFLLESQSLARTLLKSGILPGDRVLLVYPPSPQFFIAFVACLFAGIVSVPVCPPDPTKLKKDLFMFNSIVSSSGAKVALTCSSYDFMTKISAIKDAFFLMNTSSSQWPDMKWMVTDTMSTNETSSATDEFPVISSDTLAFLQYTSGSTSAPKGVMISHGNLAHNLALITSGIHLSPTTIVVSWLPHYHDMGLIGSYCGAMYCGGMGYYFSPIHFIRDPILWIRVISQYHGTHMQAPNFSYKLTAKKFTTIISASGYDVKYPWIKHLDLSSAYHMINAAEPIDAASIDLFYAVFQPYRLPGHVIYPTYGLAEHTVYVSSNGKQRLIVNKDILEDEHRISFMINEKKSHSMIMIGCGVPQYDQHLIISIVNPDTMKKLDDDMIGELWIHSPSCAMGYYNLPQQTDDTFHAHLSTDEEKKVAYLRTGDYAFIHEDEVFICGRMKDMIILRGKNYFPQDIEGECERKYASSLRGGCSAAVSINIYGEEEFVYVAEVTPAIASDNHISSYDHLCREIRILMLQLHGIQPYAIILVHPRSINKTTSGKIARQWVKKAYLNHQLKTLYTWTSSSTSSSSDDAILSSTEDNTIIQDISSPSEVDTSSYPMNPIGSSFNMILSHVKQALISSLELEPSSSIARQIMSSSPQNVPILGLGLDSVCGQQFIFQLESKYHIPKSSSSSSSGNMIADVLTETLSIPDSTLFTITQALHTGHAPSPHYRPIMYDGWKVLEEAKKHHHKHHKKPASGILPADILSKLGLKSHIDSHTFAPGCALSFAPLSWYEEISYIMIYITCLLSMISPIIMICILYMMYPIHIATTSLLIICSVLYLLPLDFYPPPFRTSIFSILAMKYYSYRIILETSSISSSSSTPIIYAYAPHGILALPPALQALLHEFITGHSFHVLGADIIFKIPIYNIIAKLFAMKSINRTSFTHIISHHHRSVALIPGGIAEMFYAGDSQQEALHLMQRKGFIRIALTTGASIVPAYTYGQSQILKTKTVSWLQMLSRIFRMSLIFFWGRWGLPIPTRGPLVTVIGSPIICPKIADPSAEVVDEYHHMFIQEMRRVYEQYKHVYNWHDPDRPLTFK